MSQNARAKSAGKKKKFSFIEMFFHPNPYSDNWITGSVLTLVVFGFAMVLSTKLGTVYGALGPLISEMLKQVMFIVAGVVLGLNFLSNWDYRKKLDGRSGQFWQWSLVVIYTFVLLLTAVIGIEINGSKAWLPIGSLFTLQPSEFGKVLLILLYSLAARSYHRQKRLFQKGLAENPDNHFWAIYQVPVTLTCISAFCLLILQKDIGSLLITLCIAIIGLLTPGFRKMVKTQRIIILVLLFLALVLFVGVYCTDWLAKLFADLPIFRHIAVRIEKMKNPYLDIHGDGYQPANALYGIADAGWFGKGFGSSVRKYGFLTQAESDYILAIVIEETGLLGLGLICVGYGILIYRLVYWAMRAGNVSDKVLLTCSAGYFMLHFIINIGGVSTMIPMTGVPLLLISAGGSALMSSCFVIGLCQNSISHIREKEALRKRRQMEYMFNDEFLLSQANGQNHESI